MGASHTLLYGELLIADRNRSPGDYNLAEAGTVLRSVGTLAHT